MNWEQKPPHFEDYAPECLQQPAAALLQSAVGPIKEEKGPKRAAPESTTPTPKRLQLSSHQGGRDHNPGLRAQPLSKISCFQTKTVITQSPLSSHSGELLGDCLVFGGRGYNPNPSGDESSDEDSQTPEEVAQIEAAEKERKRAGLPEITDDSLPSSLANKVMILAKRD